MKVFCIRHQEMVWVEKTPISEGHKVFEPVESPFPIEICKITFCDFPDGFAYIAPPEFDLEKYVERLEETIPSEAEIEAGLFETYDVDRDEMVYEVLI